MKKHTAANIAVRITAVLITVLMLITCCFAEEESDSSQNAPQKCYELITSYDTGYYSKINIKNRSIVIEGCYANDKVTDITLKNCGTVSSTLRVNEDGTFSSVINPSSPTGDSDELIITLQSGAKLDYRIMYSGNWYLPDNRLSETNNAVLENIKNSPSFSILKIVSVTLLANSVLAF